MYYVFESRYTGPNRDTQEFVDADKIEIWHFPQVNSIVPGPCPGGLKTSDGDWSITDHGGYPNIETARAVIHTKFGVVRDRDRYGAPFKPAHTNVIEVYRPGEYTPVTTDDTVYFLTGGDGVQSYITADFTDEEISELVEEVEEDAKNDHHILLAKGVIERLIKDYRQALRDGTVDLSDLVRHL